VPKPAGRGTHGNAVSHYELVATESADSGQVKRENKRREPSAHVVPHDATSRILRRDSSEMAGLGRGYAVHFYACL